MTPTRTLGWRAAEAAVLGGFAYAVGFGLRLALVVALLALGVNAAELAGERYGSPVMVRHLALGCALVSLAALAVVRGAVWFPVVALPLVAWFLLDAVAHAVRDDSAGDPERDAVADDPDLTGELLRELRAEPRNPEQLATALDRSRARVRRALDALADGGVVGRDDAGRYRVADSVGRPSILTLPARLCDRLVEPLRLL